MIRAMKRQTVDTNNSLKKKTQKRTGQMKDKEKTKGIFEKYFKTPRRGGLNLYENRFVDRHTVAHKKVNNQEQNGNNQVSLIFQGFLTLKIFLLFQKK